MERERKHTRIANSRLHLRTVLINLKLFVREKKNLTSRKNDEKKCSGVQSRKGKWEKRNKMEECARAISRRIIFKDYSPPRERKLFRSINIARPANWIKGNPFKGILERILSQRGPRVEALPRFLFTRENEPRDKSSSSNSWRSQSQSNADDFCCNLLSSRAIREIATPSM